MPFANYTDLLAAIPSWLMRSDLTAQIPDFVVLCESRNNKRLRTRDMESTANLTVGADNKFTLPTDYIEARRVLSNTDPVTALQPITLDQGTRFVTPSYDFYYAIKGSQLINYPFNASPITLDYYAKIPPLSLNATNWLLTNAPEVYLYGTLLQSAPFLEDDARIVTWGNLYEAAITELSKMDQRAVFGKTIARVRGTTP